MSGFNTNLSYTKFQFKTLIQYRNQVMTPTKLSIMKKLMYIGLVLLATVGMSSCDYDDSNDIDFIMPNENPETE